MENIALLGSTGSVGRQVLDVLKHYPQKFRVFGLAAKDKDLELKSQIKTFKPEVVSVANDKMLVNLASHKKVDTVIISTSGTVAFPALFAAIKEKKKIIQANKETIIMGGELINRELKRYNNEIIPIDSEHSAIFQCLQGEEKKSVKRIILSCSGGPFRSRSLSKVTVKDALNHPVWKMGPKITIDSATLMNKGLEVIEAHYLFNLPLEKIEVVVHPEGIIHSMVEFSDGSIKALLASPDMRGPIEYALFYPERGKGVIPSLNFSKIRGLSFSAPNRKKFPCLNLACEALKEGGTMPSALVFADEVAVEKFLSGEIRFLDIPKVIEKALEGHKKIQKPSVSDILSVKEEIRNIL